MLSVSHRHWRYGKAALLAGDISKRGQGKAKRGDRKKRLEEQRRKEGGKKWREAAMVRAELVKNR